MIVVLNRERLESSLPDVTNGLVAEPVRPHMRRHKPMHPTPESLVVLRSKHEVEVVRHQAIRKNVYGMTLARHRHERQELREIGCGMEDRPAVVGPIQDVVADPTHGRTRSSRHASECKPEPTFPDTIFTLRCAQENVTG
jgi:hypothetical protein